VQDLIISMLGRIRRNTFWYVSQMQKNDLKLP